MNTAFVVFSRDGSPYMVVETSKAGTRFKPVNDAAKNLAKAFADEYRQSEISKAELSAALDIGMEVEGPMPPNAVAAKLKAKRQNSEKYLPVVSISDTPIGHFAQHEFKNIVSYKASAFAVERYKTTFNYEVKRVRAVWDPSLSVPGTNRRGGWRCPTGTRYGGQITDRFGRNCGWGVARRIANAISDVGEQLGNIEERRAGRRRQRRERQVIERAQRAGQPSRLERGLRGVAERLEGGEQTPAAPAAGRLERGLSRIAGRLEGGEGETRVPSTPEQVAPEAPQPRRPQGRRPRAPRPEEQRQPAQPVAPARPRRPRAPVQRPEQREPTRVPTPARVPTPQVSEPTPETPRGRTLGEQGRMDFIDGFVGDNFDAADLADLISREQRNIGETDFNAEMMDANGEYSFEEIRNRLVRAQNLNERFERIRESRYGDIVDKLSEWGISDGADPRRDLTPEQTRELKNLIASYTDAIVSEGEAAAEARWFEDRLRKLDKTPAPLRPKAPAAQPAPRALYEGNEPGFGPIQGEIVRTAENELARRRGRNIVDLGDDLDAKLNGLDARAIRNEQLREFSRSYTDEDLEGAIRQSERSLRDLFENHARQANAFNEAEGRADREPIRFERELNRLIESQMRIRKEMDRFGILSQEARRRNRERNAAAPKPQRRNRTGASAQQAGRTATRRPTAADTPDAGRQAPTPSRRVTTPQAQPEAAQIGEEERRRLDAELVGVVQAAIDADKDKQKRIAAKYLVERYGADGALPWADMTPEKWAAMSQADQSKYLKSLFDHPLIKGTNGKLYKARVDEVSRSFGEFTVRGLLFEVDANGREIRNVGDFKRIVKPQQGSVYNARFIIPDEVDKKNGLATIFNNHAWMGLQAMGVNGATVGPAIDGPYVWPKMGYISDSYGGDIGPQVRDKLNEQIQAFERAGRSVVASAEQANLLRALLGAKNADGTERRFTHQEMIFALAHGTEKNSVTARGRQIRNWVIQNAQPGSSNIKFADRKIEADPRRILVSEPKIPNAPKAPNVPSAPSAPSAPETPRPPTTPAATAPPRRAANIFEIGGVPDEVRNSPTLDEVRQGLNGLTPERIRQLRPQANADEVALQINNALEVLSPEAHAERAAAGYERARQNAVSVLNTVIEAINRDKARLGRDLTPNEVQRHIDDGITEMRRLIAGRGAGPIDERIAKIQSRFQDILRSGNFNEIARVRENGMYLNNAIYEVAREDGVEKAIANFPDLIRAAMTKPAFDPAANDTAMRLGQEAAGRIAAVVKEGRLTRMRRMGQYLKQRYGDGDLPWKDMTPEKFDTLSPDEKRAYIQNLYSHDKIVGSNGKLYRIKATVNGFGMSFNVSASIVEIDESGNTIRTVGNSSRSINLETGSVYNASLFITNPIDRNNGLASIYNGHAFIGLQQIGVKSARVTAADDGQFVWAKIGYKPRPASLPNGARITLQKELDYFKAFGGGGLIRNAEEFALVKALLDKQRVSHMEMIFALSGDQRDVMRDRQVKAWFLRYAPISGGRLSFRQELIEPDPRRLLVQGAAAGRPRGGARRPRAPRAAGNKSARPTGERRLLVKATRRTLGKPIGGVAEVDGDGDGFVTGPDGEDNIPAAAQQLVEQARQEIADAKPKTPTDQPTLKRLGKAIADIIQKDIDGREASRQKRVGKYMAERHADGDLPWAGLSRREFEAMSKRERFGVASAMFDHPFIRGTNGKNYAAIPKSYRDLEYSQSNDSVYIEADIWEVDDTGNIIGRNPAGVMQRQFRLDKDVVEHQYFRMYEDKDKKSGIATIVNGYAFAGYKALGFDDVELQAAMDGPYVWALMGFDAIDEDGRGLSVEPSALDAAFKYFDEKGGGGLIRNEAEYTLLKSLFAQGEVSHQQLIFALGGGQGDLDRDERVKSLLLGSEGARMPYGRKTLSGINYSDPRELLTAEQRKEIADMPNRIGKIVTQVKPIRNRTQREGVPASMAGANWEQAALKMVGDIMLLEEPQFMSVDESGNRRVSLPPRAFWRNEEFIGADRFNRQKAQKIERLLGSFYGPDGSLNDGGKATDDVLGEVQAGGGRMAGSARLRRERRVRRPSQED